MLPREVQLLFGKEWRQLTRSRGALLSAILVPGLMLLVLPNVLAGIVRLAPDQSSPHDERVPFGAFAEVERPDQLPRILIPLLVTIAGLTLPTVLASHVMLTEREARTLELLIALPIRISHLIAAKLLAVVALSVAVVLPLLGFDIAILVSSALIGPGDAVAMVVLLIGALSYSTAAALIMSLIARDHRAASNLAGALLAPSILGSAGFLMLMPGEALRPAALGVIFMIVAASSAAFAIRSVTFERLLI